MDFTPIVSVSLERVLADFQEWTGIYDVDDAIRILDASDWDLWSAIDKVMPEDSFKSGKDGPARVDGKPEASTAIETATDIVSAGNNVHTDHSTQPSTSQSTSRKRLLNFSVHFNEKNVQIDIPDTGTVGELKLNLHTELGVAPCQQLLKGWVRLPQSDTTVLSSLSLPRENILFLSTVNPSDGATADDEPNVSDRLSSTYTLKITDERTLKQYSLKYPGSRNILSIKTDVFNLTDVPVRYQAWTGWPLAVDDNTCLALSGVRYPEHELSLRNAGPGPEQPQPQPAAHDKQSVVVDLIDSDSSSVEEFEDASESFNVDDDMFTDSLGSERTQPLIPDNVDDEAIGCIHFSEHFTARYGPLHPTFFTGTFEDALKEACVKPAKDRKILAMYLHHDGSVLANVFCTQLLCFESVLMMLENNFVVWGWDLTYETNKLCLQASVGRCLGSQATMAIRNIPVDKLPAVILIMKIRSSTDIYTVINGNVSVNELLLRLVDAVEVFTEHQKVEAREERERAARELVKWEQDQAYHESLEADRAKEEAKKQQAAMETEERRRVETERAQEQARKERYRLQVQASLPPEPADCTPDITKIRFRLPKGQSLERRFTVASPLKVLLDYLVVEGYPTQEYKVISSWPRKDLTSLDSSQTLQQLKLCPQETLILEER